MVTIRASLKWCLAITGVFCLMVLGSSFGGCRGRATTSNMQAANSGAGDPDPDPDPTPAPAPAPTPPATTGVATLRWGAPPANSDGSTLSDLQGYHIYYGTRPGVYTTQIDVGRTTNHDVDQLRPGTYYFAVTAYDALDNESDLSNEVSKVIQ